MTEIIENTYNRFCCPLCELSNVSYIGDLKYLPPILFSSHEIELTRTPELWKCNVCYSWYTNNILPENTAASLYKSGNSDNRWLQAPIEEGKSVEIIRLLSDIFKPGKKVLDIGCNTGEVLDFAKNRGCITSGVEFSSTCHGQLREKGHECFSDINEVNGKYDVIVVFDIIEHLYNLPLFIDTCNNILSDNGLLLILTGDIHSLSARFCKSKWWYVNFPEHIIFPSKKYYQSISGFRVSSWIKTYASLKFKQSFHLAIKGILRNIYRRRYVGLPSIGSDHVLICLNKHN